MYICISSVRKRRKYHVFTKQLIISPLNGQKQFIVFLGMNS